MKIKITLRTLSTIIALAMTPIFAFSQNNSLTPDAAGCFSTWSLPQNMGAMLNSATIDMHVTISPSGLSLYFSSDRPGGLGGTDIYVSQRPTLTSAWGAPQSLGATVNSSGGDGVTGFSRDGRTAFVYSSRPGGLGGFDIYIMTRTDPNNDFGWSAPVPLTVINSASGEIGSTYFEDPVTGAGTLIFQSNRPGGLGSNDFYQSTRNADGTFNAPTPITELSSPAGDERAAISRDGLEIFISTNRPGTQGMFDIFVSTRASVSAPWNPPVPVAGINTASNEYSPTLSADGTTMYFSSNRAGGVGDMDLYSTARVSVNRSATADFDGDGRSDISVFRPSDGTWYLMQSGSNTFRAQQFGMMGDKIVPGDYDGDGRIDFAVFRQVSMSGIWYILQSSDNAFRAVQWGLATDKAVPGDYDGDGRTDIAVYRNGVWYIAQSSNGQFATHQFGASSDIPVAANVQ
ncbi:MAG: FG-GAP-like repeat-containing protein [Acidobacteriota bacterium]|nr:FG-GAP-like repeat-containing protein [Acidobacteriota bacterium]